MAPVLTKFTQGLTIVTDYSGTGQAEAAMAHFHTALQGRLERWAAGFFVHAATDVAAPCRAVLAAHNGASSARHLFGDILERMKPHTMRDDLNELHKKYLQKSEHPAAGDSKDVGCNFAQEPMWSSSG